MVSVRFFRTISAYFNIWTLIDIIDFVVTVHFSGDSFMTLSAMWRHLFHDIIFTALCRFLLFLFNFKEVLYVQYMYLISNCAI
jgi:hypothetical protein